MAAGAALALGCAITAGEAVGRAPSPTVVVGFGHHTAAIASATQKAYANICRSNQNTAALLRLILMFKIPPTASSCAAYSVSMSDRVYWLPASLAKLRWASVAPALVNKGNKQVWLAVVTLRLPNKPKVTVRIRIRPSSVHKPSCLSRQLRVGRDIKPLVDASKLKMPKTKAIASVIAATNTRFLGNCGAWLYQLMTGAASAEFRVSAYLKITSGTPVVTVIIPVRTLVFVSTNRMISCALAYAARA